MKNGKKEEFAEHAIAFDLAYYMDDMREVRKKGQKERKRQQKAR